MRVIALLSLMFGFVTQLFLDGQPYSHAVLGIVCGVVAIGCGLSSSGTATPNPTARWEGRIMAGLGLVLAVVLIPQLPSAYEFQNKFNRRSDTAHGRLERTNLPRLKPE
jgi:hypothetical protein